MPGALTWDPTPPGGALSTARGAQNPSADNASLSPTEVAAARALVSGAGSLAAARVRNPAALAKLGRRLAQARTKAVVGAFFGDSLTTGTGATAIQTLPTNGVAGDVYGLPGVLRGLLNARFGTSGGAYISAASTSGQVTRSGGALMTGYGPHYALNGQNSYGITGAGQYVEFALPACTEIFAITWEDTTASYGVGSSVIDVSVDGGAATTYTGTGGTSVHKVWQVANMTGLSNATHTVRFTRNAGNNMVHGVFYRTALGVSVFTMGIGSSTSEHLIAAANTTWTPNATQADRIVRATFQTLPLDFAIIITGHNDCSQQVARSLTPQAVAANISTAIGYLRANSGSPVILLVTDPWPNLTGTPVNYPDYWPYITALADGTSDVAAITTADLLGTYTQGNAESLYSDTIHLTSAGYAVWGQAIAGAIAQARAAA